jgi:hypothetical protein
MSITEHAIAKEWALARAGLIIAGKIGLTAQIEERAVAVKIQPVIGEILRRRCLRPAHAGIIEKDGIDIRLL